MTESELVTLIDKLCSYSSEQEWFEFKENRYSTEELGQYISALANSACINDKTHGYLVFGIHDKTHAIVGTSFDPYIEKGKGEQPLQLWLTMLLEPNLGFSIYPFDYSGKRLVVFEVNAATDRPVSFHEKEWVRIGECKTELRNHPEKSREIWNRKYRLNDWSAQFCKGATLEDLHPEAMAQARVEFKTKYPFQASDVNSWDNETFLNKAKIAIHGKLTNTAIILLGKPESAALISPALARISWILKDDKNSERDYEHFAPPFLLNVGSVFKKIRNLTIRHLPDGTLFPLETTQYDQWVLREALHNCIAHQDYALKGRINVIETPSSISLTNAGSFLPGSVENVIRQDAPQEIYRNPFLAEAMVHLNMIDTQGGGIKKMFSAQIKRFFPLPDYDLSNADRVAVKLRGEIIDERYTRMLIARTNIDLWDAIILDKIQKKIPVTREQYNRLKKNGVAEGRFPNVFVSATVARAIGESAQHMKNRGMGVQYDMDQIYGLVLKHAPVTRREIDNLLMSRLPDVMSESQKKRRIHYYLTVLAKESKIVNRGSRRAPRWECYNDNTSGSQ